MTHGKQVFADFMLTHISEILKTYPIYICDYSLGQRVECLEDWGAYKVRTIGTVCGIEFFDDDIYDDSGIYYQIKVESSQALLPDGRILPCACDKVERIFATHVTAINDATLDVLTEVVA